MALLLINQREKRVYRDGRKEKYRLKSKKERKEINVISSTTVAYPLLQGNLEVLFKSSIQSLGKEKLSNCKLLSVNHIVVLHITVNLVKIATSCLCD